MNCNSTPISDAVGDVQIVGESYKDIKLSRNVREDKNGAVNVKLANQSDDSSFRTGSKAMYDLQRMTDSEWSSLYCVDDEKEWSRDEVVHDPNSGFSWEFTFSGESVSPPRDHIRVNQSVYEASGEFRFVYYGLVEPTLESDGDTRKKAIAIQFEL